MSTFVIRDVTDLRRLSAELRQGFEGVSSLPVLRDTSGKLDKLNSNYFDAEVGPGDNRWVENTPATKARKGHGDVLQDTLKMRRAMTESGAAGAVRDIYEEGTQAGLVHGLDDGEIPYWKYHDTPGGALPWRPFIGMSNEVLDVIAESLIENKVKGMAAAA